MCHPFRSYINTSTSIPRISSILEVIVSCVDRKQEQGADKIIDTQLCIPYCSNGVHLPRSFALVWSNVIFFDSVRRLNEQIVRVKDKRDDATMFLQSFIAPTAVITYS